MSQQERPDYVVPSDEQIHQDDNRIGMQRALLHGYSPEEIENLSPEQIRACITTPLDSEKEENRR
jgi:hypothetical protein